MHDLWEAMKNLDEDSKKMANRLVKSLLQLSRENIRNAKKAEKEAAV